MKMDALERLSNSYRNFTDGRGLIRHGGRVVAISQHFYRVRGLAGHARLGDIVAHDKGAIGRRGEIIQIDYPDVTVAPFRGTDELRVGDIVFNEGPRESRPDASWLGRVINALDEPVDGKGPVHAGGAEAKDHGRLPAPLARTRVDKPFQTGIRIVDIFTPLCYGQRFGLFAGSGVGKSTLLAMLARAEAFDVVVVALVGERGREVREFVEEAIGAEGMKKSVIVVATSDESAMMRRRAPESALQIAEHFRDDGKRVLLLLDSITRYAHALREVAISVSEPPVARGYPASVFTDLPKLLERAGPGADGSGSITAILSVLVDGDDHNDPVADAVRGILDGHLVMERSIADQGRYPPVNPLTSISRLSSKVWTADQSKLVLQLRAMISRFEETRDLRLLGAWQPGVDAALDKAVATVPVIYEALCQSPGDPISADPFADLAEWMKRDARSAPADPPEPQAVPEGG